MHEDLKELMPDWRIGDERVPTEQEQRSLSRLVYMALVDLRALIRDGRNEQARALVDAIHNVPLLMYSDRFSFRAFTDFLRIYQERFGEDCRSDYLAEWK